MEIQGRASGGYKWAKAMLKSLFERALCFVNISIETCVCVCNISVAADKILKRKSKEKKEMGEKKS